MNLTNQTQTTVHMVSQAMERHGRDIRPINGSKRFRDGIRYYFTDGKSFLTFWYERLTSEGWSSCVITQEVV